MVGPESLINRLKNNCIDVDGCWIWQRSLTSKGYAKVKTGSRTDNTRKTAIAHRLMYELLVGEIPANHELDHLCKQRNCINPDHLEPVLHRENVLRGNGLAGMNARKTHCKQGHEYTESNTRMYGNKRRCRACGQ